jgi:hypothetical protein
MKTCIAIVSVIVLALANAALAQMTQPQAYPSQSPPMYDQSYRGPTNMYGQPVLSVQPKPQDQSGQQSNDGLIPMAAQGLQSVGSYFWSYMPAPVRGVESPYTVAPGSGNVSVNFVPGSN